MPYVSTADGGAIVTNKYPADVAYSSPEEERFLETIGLDEIIGADEQILGSLGDTMDLVEYAQTVGCVGDDVIGFLNFKKAWRAVKKVGKKAIKVGKFIAPAVALAFPAVGVPLTAGLAIADKAISTAEKGKKLGKELGITKVFRNTKALAKAGNKDAARAMKALRYAARYRKKHRIKAGALSSLGSKYRSLPKSVKQKAIKPAGKLRRACNARNPKPKGTKGYFVTSRGRVSTGAYARV